MTGNKRYLIGALCLVAMSFLLDGIPQAHAEKTSKKTILKGNIDQWSSVCNAAGIRLSGGNVDKVMLGTPAYYSGLRANDKILNCDVSEKAIKVTFERGGNRYGVTVPYDPSAIQPDGYKPPKQREEVSNVQAVERLRDFDVIIFVDCSGSMSDRIASEKNVTKWEWTRNHISDFNKVIADNALRPMTLVMFSDRFQVHQNCTAKDLQDVFSRQRPDGGTELAPPLSQILRERLRKLSERPCVIAVLHDGLANDEPLVEQVLHDASHALLPGQLFVTFIQIGDDEAGAEAMRQYDNIDTGKKDMVKAQLFDEVRANGLAAALAKAIGPRIPVAATGLQGAATAPPKAPSPSTSPAAKSGTGFPTAAAPSTKPAKP